MTVTKSFNIILRIFFIVYAFIFSHNAFYGWDGYSYYMSFWEFLPDLSLAFVLWTIPSLILAVSFWIVIYGLFRIIPKSLKAVRLESLMAFFVFIVLPFFIKRVFYNHVSVSGYIGLSEGVFLVACALLVAALVYFGNRYSDSLLNGLNSRLTPVVWLLAVLLIVAIPFSLVSLTKEEPPAAEYLAGSDTRTERPNVILITLDALTALNMQVYGYNRATTPFISEWARDAIVFKNVQSLSNWTTPSLMSLMTGQRLWTHRVWYRAIHFPVKNYPNNLPRILRDEEYNNYSFAQNIYAHPDTLGIGRSFITKDRARTFERPLPEPGGILARISSFYSKYYIDKPIVKVFIEKFHPSMYDISSSIVRIKNLKKSFKAARSQNSGPSQAVGNAPGSIVEIPTQHPPAIVFNRFLDYVSSEDNKKEPFKAPYFVWLHIYPPHDPYHPPRPYLGTYGDDGINTKALQKEYGPDEQAYVDISRNRYDEYILYCDNEFRSFWQRLVKTVDLSDTIVIFSADHGQSFSHNYQGHDGPHLYQPFINIPLIVRMPGAKEGKVIDLPVEQTDIAPTILELAGIPAPEWMEGRSLLPLLEGGSLESRPVYSMQLIQNPVRDNHPITKGTIAVRDGDYKLIYYLDDDRSLLFNIRSDPGETLDLYKEDPETAQRLKKLIDDNLSRVNAGRNAVMAD